MKLKLIALLILAVSAGANCFAKHNENPDTITAGRAFLELKPGVLDLLDTDSREYLLSEFGKDSLDLCFNSMRSISTLDAYTPDYIKLQLTDVSSLEIKILKSKKEGDLVMTVYTTGGEGETQDSELNFYDSSMRQLPTEKYFKVPKLEDFFDLKGFKTKKKEIEGMLPFYTIRFEANPSNSDISAKLTLGDILTVEDQKIIELLMKPDVIFQWNGKEYKMKK